MQVHPQLIDPLYKQTGKEKERHMYVVINVAKQRSSILERTGRMDIGQ